MAVETESAPVSVPAAPSGPGAPASVVVHPLVLLSVVDHFNRMGKIGNQNRVVGVLLGSWSSKNQVRIPKKQLFFYNEFIYSLEVLTRNFHFIIFTT